MTNEYTRRDEMNNQPANPYAVLGVPPTASSTQVREAYRRLAKQFHPDRHSDAQATERMQRINQAWETLSSPAARARYDDGGRRRPARRLPALGRRTARLAVAVHHAPDLEGLAVRVCRASHARRRRRSVAVGPRPRAVPVVVLVTALFGGLVPLPILGLLLFFLARAVFRTGD